jgi:hypothetical protein
VSAASFAIDGFYGSVAPWITVPPQLVATWKGKQTPREGRIVETLKFGYTLGSHAGRWQGELPWLFDLRNENVHYDEEFAAPVVHPVMGHVSPERVVYTAENSTRAVDVMLDVITICAVNNLKPTAHRDHVDWCIRWEQNIRRLVLERENLTIARANSAHANSASA